MARITRYTTKGEQGFIWMPPKIDNPIKKVEIVSDGVTHDISNQIIGLGVKSNITTSVSTFGLSMNNPGTYVGEYTNIFTEGDDVIIWLGYGSEYIKVFRGQIEKQIFKFGPAHTIHLSGRDYGSQLLKKYVNATYEDMDPADIITDAGTGLIPKFTTGITTNNVATVGTNITGITFKNKKVFDAHRELAKLSDFHFYIDTNKDINFFNKNSKQSTKVAAVVGVNVTKLDMGIDIKEVRNKITVYGKNLAGDVQYLETVEDASSQTNYNGISEEIIAATELESAADVKERADGEILFKKTPPQKGSVTIPGAPYLKQGEQLRISSPYEKINGWFLPTSISHSFKGNGFTTTLTIERPTSNMITIMKQRELGESQITDLTNVNNMTDSFVISLKDETLIETYGDTQLSEESLILQTGKDDGTMKTESKFLNYSPLYCELRYSGESLGASIFSVTFDNEVADYQELNLKDLSGVQNTGTIMKIKVRLRRNTANPEPRLKTLCVLFKR